MNFALLSKAYSEFILLSSSNPSGLTVHNFHFGSAKVIDLNTLPNNFLNLFEIDFAPASKMEISEERFPPAKNTM